MSKKSLTPVLLCVVLGIVVLVSWNSIYANVHCIIRGVGFDLVGCDLRGADFSGENLTGVDLSGANLTGANLGVTELIKIMNPKFAQIPLLSDNNMFFDSDFSNCTRHCFVLMRIVYWYGAFLYKNQPAFNDGITKINEVIASGANLSNANLTNADLTGVNLTGANLTNADFSGATLVNVSSGRITGIPNVLPADWMLVNGYLLGPGVNLANTNLSNIDLSHANLSRTNLIDIDLSHANLSHANLIGIKSHHITGSSLLLPTDWQLVAGHLVGPTADLMGADFTGEQLAGINFVGSNLAYVNLTNANLSGANLTDTNLRGANLSDANLGEANLTNIQSTGIIGTPKTLPSDWQLINRFLVGPRANLSNADFSHANLANLNLTHVNFAGANLSYADLSGANLAGANLTGANLAGVVWNNTTCPDGTITKNTRCEIP